MTCVKLRWKAYSTWCHDFKRSISKEDDRVFPQGKIKVRLANLENGVDDDERCDKMGPVQRGVQSIENDSRTEGCIRCFAKGREIMPWKVNCLQQGATSSSPPCSVNKVEEESDEYVVDVNRFATVCKY